MPAQKRRRCRSIWTPKLKGETGSLQKDTEKDGRYIVRMVRFHKVYTTRLRESFVIERDPHRTAQVKSKNTFTRQYNYICNIPGARPSTFDPWLAGVRHHPLWSFKSPAIKIVRREIEEFATMLWRVESWPRRRGSGYVRSQVHIPCALMAATRLAILGAESSDLEKCQSHSARVRKCIVQVVMG